MALKIRLKRMGKRNNPFYRLVVVDSRWRRDGKSIANVGWYDPVKQPAQCNINHMEVYKWLENGAQVTETARSLLKQQGIWDKFRTGDYKENPEPVPQSDSPVRSQAAPGASDFNAKAQPEAKPVGEAPPKEDVVGAMVAEKPVEESEAEESKE